MTVRAAQPLSCATTVALAVSVLFGSLFAVRLASQAPALAPLTMLSKDGRRPIPETVVNGQEYAALDDLAPIFQLTVREETLGNATVSYKGRTIVLTADQSLASVAGRLVSLPAPVLRSGRRWLVPIEFLARALGPIYDQKIDLRKPSRLLVVGDLRVPRITVRYDAVGAGGRLTIDATPRTTSTVDQSDDRVRVKFDADAIDLPGPLAAAVPPGGLVQTIRVVDPTTLEVDLAPRAAGIRAASQPIDTSMRLTIDLVPPPAQVQAPQAPPAPPPQPPPGELTPASPTIHTIAIDPGHGGTDDGVKGAGGTKEKDIVLAVAHRLKAAVESRLGIRVLLTRDDDRNVPIDERTSLANNNKADLFISLHANASLRPVASGAIIYSAAFDHIAPPLAGPQRVPTFGGGLREIDLVAWDQAQTRFLDQSTSFATVLQQQFQNRVPLAAHPLERAPLTVLESANMPAVLVEMGFLSNSAQEKQLAGSDFQNAFVQAVSDAVVKFRDMQLGVSR